MAQTAQISQICRHARSAENATGSASGATHPNVTRGSGGAQLPSCETYRSAAARPQAVSGRPERKAVYSQRKQRRAR